MVPQGINDAQVRAELINEFGIEISGGLGPYAGKMWRIGVMGHSARKESIIALLSALESILGRHDYSSGQDKAVLAANAVFATAEV